MRSTTGLLAYLHSVGPLYWKPQLQAVTASSTKKSEYYSAGAGDCARVLVGFRQLCHSLGFTQDSREIQSDNRSTLYYFRTKLSYSKSRHIKIQFHYVKDLIRDGEVHFKYCPTEDMVADLFTKALPASQFERLAGILYNQL
jgi:KUP system potassium uptake protein